MSQDSQHTRLLRSHMQQAGISSFKELGRTAGVTEWQVRQLRSGKASQMQVETLYKLSQALRVPLLDLLLNFSDLPAAAIAAPVQSTPLTTAPSQPEDLDTLTEGTRLTEHVTEREAQLGAAIPAKSSEDELETLAEGTRLTDRPAEREVLLSTEVNNLKQEYQRLQLELAEQRSLLHQEFLHSSLNILESLLLQLPTAAYAAQQNPQVPASRLLPLLRPLEQLLRSWGVEAIAPVGTELPFDPYLHELMDGTANPGDQVRVRYTGYRQGSRLLYRAKVSPV